MTARMDPRTGDLQVWWIPQIPMPSFTVPVTSVADGVRIMDILADYDAFQFRHRVKGDYANVGGIQRWCEDNGDGKPGWEDWHDEETGEDDPRAWVENKSKGRRYSLAWRMVVKTDKSAGVDGCWLWTGCVTNGYGAIRQDSKKHYAHRVAWELTNGEIPDGMFVCHRCDNRLCVNPSHMFIGTHDDNMRDCKNKGRSPRGESNGQAKLSSEDVLSVIRMRASGVTQAEVAAKFGIHASTVGLIENGSIWSHTTGVAPR